MLHVVYLDGQEGFKLILTHAFLLVAHDLFLDLEKGYKRYQVNGRYYIDGGFTDNLPVIFPGETIRIQPFFTADPVEIMINEKYTFKSTIQGIVTQALYKGINICSKFT